MPSSLACRFLMGSVLGLFTLSGSSPGSQSARPKPSEPMPVDENLVDDDAEEVEKLRDQLRNLRQIARGGEIASGEIKPSQGGGMLGLLLEFSTLQDELKITEAQKTKIRALGQQTSDRRRSIKDEMKIKKKELKAMGLEYSKQAKLDAYVMLHQENEATLNAVLRPKQKERLEQIRLRILGPSALAEPAVAARVGLTPDQRDQVEALLVDLKSRQMQLVEGFRLAPPKVLNNVSPAPTTKEAARAPKRSKETQGRVTKLGDDRETLEKLADDRIGKLLQSRQRKAFNTLLGPPFDLSALFKIKEPKAEEEAPADEAKPRKGSVAEER